MSTNQESLKGTIKEVLKELFRDAPIEDVLLESYVDDEGDKILRIYVILTHMKKDLDREALFHMVGRLMEALEERGRDEFPVVSFFTRADAKRLKLAAA